MPSKPRKNSKTPLKLSYSDNSSPSPSPSPQNSLSLALPTPTPEPSEEHISSLLEQASIKFPSLISKSAYVARIVDIKSDAKSKYAPRIWLSHSAFTSSTFTPGTIVSVSLASSRRKVLGGSPLESLTDKYGDGRNNKLGNYFALAEVYPSCEVLKNGVRLSWSLSCTMGHPTSGNITFVSPMQTCSVNGTLNGIDKLHNSTNIRLSRLSFCSCKDLYLELIPSRSGLKRNDGLVNSSTSETKFDQFENGNVSSPKTPLIDHSKLNSPAGVCLSNEASFSAYDMEEAADQEENLEKELGDNKIRKMYENFAVIGLHGRLLLHGNVVSIPLLKKTYLFCVEDGNKLSLECPSQELIAGETQPVLFNEAPNPAMVHQEVAFVLSAETKVHISMVPLLTRIPNERGSTPVEIDCKNIKDKLADHVPKLGGLSKEFALLKDIIVSSLLKNTLSSLGLRTTKGVLLYGPPGTGKTSLALSCVRDAGVNLFSINGPEIISQFYGESEQALHEVFESASRAAPAVVFIDELDAIAPARKDGGEELSQRMVATLLNLMDGISRTEGMLVIAASNRPDTIDPALRRPGRLDREIEIGVPSPKQRLDILISLLKGMDHSLIDSQITNLASSTHGFVGSDLAALCNEAALVCLRHHVVSKKKFDSSEVTSKRMHSKQSCLGYYGCGDAIMGEPGPTNKTSDMLSADHVEPASSSLSGVTVSTETAESFGFSGTNQQDYNVQNTFRLTNEKVASVAGEEALLKVTFDDFEKAKMRVRPSAMREVALEVPKVSWEDVGGQNEVKKQLMEAVEWPQKHQEAFKRIGTRPPTGVLMFGPPGCSKTLMARAVASKAGLNFLAVKGPELFSKWVGESEKAVRSLFAKARANAPSIIFFDEIDGLANIRGQENDGGASVGDRVMSQLLVELDGLHQRVDVTVIAATNRPDKIDPALLRPGRFDRLLYVGPPNELDREEIFRIHVQKMPCGSDVNISELSILTEGCTGADISLICREAAIAALEEDHGISEISMAHFKMGLRRVQPSEVQSFEEFSKKFQRLVCSDTPRNNLDCQPSLSTSNPITFWSRMKSLSQTLLRFPAASAR